MALKYDMGFKGASDRVYLEQFLKVASGDNVFIEFSVAVNRYRLCCKSCGLTLTYSDGYGVDRETVDASLQEFAKEHRHSEFEKKVLDGVYWKYPDGTLEPVTLKSDTPKPQVAPKPKRTGRRFR